MITEADYRKSRLFTKSRLCVAHNYAVHAAGFGLEGRITATAGFKIGCHLWKTFAQILQIVDLCGLRRRDSSFRKPDFSGVGVACQHLIALDDLPAFCGTRTLAMVSHLIMKMSWRQILPIFGLILLVIAQVATASAEVDRALMNDLIETIAKVRTGESSTVRTEAAERLSRLTKRMKPKDVDDKTLSDLVSLLDTHEDSVRAWVAASLGNLGPRARVAAPKLLEILAEVECIPVVGGLTSEGFIQLALKRMGVKVPPPPDCENSK